MKQLCQDLGFQVKQRKTFKSFPLQRNIVQGFGLSRVERLLLAEGFADEAEPEHAEEDAAHEVGQHAGGPRVHHRLDAVPGGRFVQPLFCRFIFTRTHTRGGDDGELRPWHFIQYLG